MASKSNEEMAILESDNAPKPQKSTNKSNDELAILDDKPDEEGASYPQDHQFGMEVPDGGSNCAKCEYLKDPQQCGNEYFIRWQGSDVIPVDVNKYCCDVFEAAKEDVDAQ